MGVLDENETIILLVGKDGQVGWELNRTLATLGKVFAVGRKDLDLTDTNAIREKISEIKPQVIINAAAYTAVDQAEKESELAHAINAIAPQIMAEEAKKCGALLIHYSTDYIFDGHTNTPYTEEDEAKPVNVYGKTKLSGEQAIQSVDNHHLIFRLSWVYGMRGRNFLLTIKRLAAERDELKIVDDQVGVPTWCRIIAESTSQVLAQCREKSSGFLDTDYIQEVSGLYHMTGVGQTSWHGFAKAIIGEETKKESSLINKKVDIIPIPTSAYPLPASRSPYSVLSNNKFIDTFGIRLPDWRLQLKLAMS